MLVAEVEEGAFGLAFHFGIAEVRMRIALGGQRLLAAAAVRQQLALLRVAPLHAPVLEPDLHLSPTHTDTDTDTRNKTGIRQCWLDRSAGSPPAPLLAFFASASLGGTPAWHQPSPERSLGLHHQAHHRTSLPTRSHADIATAHNCCRSNVAADVSVNDIRHLWLG